ITTWANVLPMQVVMKLAGHSDASTTTRYYASITGDMMTRARAASGSAIGRVSEQTDAQLTRQSDFERSSPSDDAVSACQIRRPRQGSNLQPTASEAVTLSN